MAGYWPHHRLKQSVGNCWHVYQGCYSNDNRNHGRVSTLRQAGAREIHLRISSPPALFPCFFGIDFPTKTKLIAAEKDVETIRKFVGADSLGYISMEGLMLPFKNASDYCTSCFCGKYKVDVSDIDGKHGLEKHTSVLPLNPDISRQA